MDVQLKKGMLDACVLASIARGDTYGYKITQDIVTIMQFSESALYPVLRRLEKQGLFNTYTVEQNGRLRKYYRITPEGNARLCQYRQELWEFSKIIQFVTDEVATNDQR